MLKKINLLIVSVSSSWRCLEKKLLDPVASFADLIARLYIAKVFFSSGWNKVTDWDATLYLFQEEYHVPFLLPKVAATIGTGGELSLSVLLLLGLCTRFSACGLFVLNIVAVISYYDSLKDSPAALQDHLEWGILLSILMGNQVKALTLDYQIARRLIT